MPLPRIQKRNATGETARLITGQFNVTTPPGMVVKQSPTGTEWRDDKPKWVLAITGTGSGSGIGSGSSPIPANDQSNVYEAVEATWAVEDNDFVVIEKENGIVFDPAGVPLIEANGVTDVPEGSVVIAYPSNIGGNPFYYFFWTGSEGSGSGDGFLVECENGTHHKVRISGTTVTVTEA